MANPTTNFGWVMPTSSSLVTNLPADFNTFGQAVDTSMSELLGGTTGQVLSKTSNTNMDFTWVTPTDQTPLTTKGDLFAFSTVDARLPAGANETRLVADSAQTLGLKYVADTTNYAIAAKGDLLAGTAADTLQALTVGTNEAYLKCDSTAATGLKWDYDSWTSYTPTIAPVSGSFTTASATGRYKQIGKTVFVQVKGTITTVGTGSGVTMTIPFTSANQGQDYTGAGRNSQNGDGLQVLIQANAGVLRVFTYANGNAAASGNILSCAIVYEIA